jgi:2,4-dienoyl-CoA reductase-like NADH-dependent reductase (Old Yellow Enzyme family)
MKISPFEEVKLAGMNLKNRIVRSATYEGASDNNGFPSSEYLSIYKTLAKNDVGMIITGFSYISRVGKAMQQAQSGIDSREKTSYFRKITDEVHSYNCPIIIQLAHAGRQTIKSETSPTSISSSTKRSIYFREKPELISDKELDEVINQFTDSALYAKEAGFDGVQLHAAHGYLLHQFILPETNKLKNKFGIDKSTGLGTKFLEAVFDKIKNTCGHSFPVLIKISGDHDLSNNFFPRKFENLISFLDKKQFDAIEISCGTMDYALNIFRGGLNIDTILEYNPLFKTNNKIKKSFYRFTINKFMSSRFNDFKPTYNLIFAERAKKLTSIPIISVGGFRSKHEIEYAISNRLTDLVGLSRPFICEPDFVKRLEQSKNGYLSKCTNCNECVFMCDSGRVTRCYSKNKCN